jgi:hypothetical protein
VRLHRWSGRVFADYRQFYFRDPASDPLPPTDYDEEDVRRRVKVVPELIVVQPARNTTVPVAVEVHDGHPGADPGRWDHVAECSLEVASGEVQLLECAAPRPLLTLAVPEGWYRVRVLFAGLASVRGLRGRDRYLVQFWPAPPIPGVRLVKEWAEVRAEQLAPPDPAGM